MKFTLPTLRTLFTRKAILPRLRKNESFRARLRCGERLETRAMLAADALSEWQNHALPTDVNADGYVTPMDALRVINELNSGGARDLSAPVESINRTRFMAAGEPQRTFLDVNGDGLLTPIDALAVINRLNAAQDEQVRIRVEITDLAGVPIDNVPLGQDFQIRGFVKDLREPQNDPQRGAFSVYFDVNYDATKMAVDFDGRTIEYGAEYTGGHRPNAQITATAGLLDDIGALAGLTPVGSEEKLVFIVPMTATARGTAVFTADPEDSPLLEVAVFGGAEVPASEILFVGDQVILGMPPTAVNDAVTVLEDTPINTINVLANDTVHPMGQGPLEVVAVTPAAHGTVNIGTGGANVVYTPAPNFAGEDTFTYTVEDANGDQATATVTVTVTNLNDPPDANDDLEFVVEAGSTNNVLPVLANDSTAPDTGETLMITAFSAPSAGGTVTIAAGGQSLIYTPLAGFAGMEGFTYTITDSNGLTAQASVIVTVSDDPTADPDTFTVAEDSTNIPLNVLANDELSPGVPGTLTISAVSATSNNGTVTIAPDNLSLIYTPAANFFGTETFTYTLVDGQGGQATGMVTVTVTSVNDPPTATDDMFMVVVNSSENNLPVLANDSIAPDVDETLMITDISIGSANGTLRIAPSRDSIFYTPVPGFVGVETFTYTISDSNASMDTAMVTVTVQGDNQGPVAVDDTFTVAEDSTATPLTVLANDTDPTAGDTLTIMGVGETSGDGTVTVAPDNLGLIYTPAPNFVGTETFTYTVRDSAGMTDIGMVTITVTAVNDAPVAMDDTQTTAEDTPLTIDPATLLANDTDVDGGTLTVTAVNNAVNGTVSLSEGMITFTPTANFNGMATFEYTVSDGNGGTDTGTVTVTVTPVNDAPIAVDDTRTTAEDTPLTIEAATLLANDTNVDADTLTLTAVSNAVGGTVSLTGSTITFTPTANFNGAATFDYTVSDGNGGTDTGTVTIDVTAVNDAPVAVDDTRTTLQDMPLTIDPATLVANDTDADNDPLTVTAVTNAVNGAVALTGGMITFTPTAGFMGTASFDYTVNDGNGGTDTGTVTVTVTDNAAPVAGDDTQTTMEDTPLTINQTALLANDTDADGDTLTITSVGSAVNGAVALNAGVITFTPSLNFNGNTASFVYTVSDGNGATDTATVTVNVTAVNDAPVATDDMATAVEDTALTIDPATLLANDTDVENNALTITAVSGAINGTATLNAGMITFVPSANFNGPGASFQYTVSDGNGGTDTGTVNVTVTAVNDNPTAAPDTFTVTRDTANNTLNVLANDTDVDGDASMLTITAVGVATNGTVTIAADSKSLLYTPTPGFVGPETFTYTISDGSGGTATATVTVNVIALATGSLSGFVYVDSDGDGVKDTAETPLAGVTIQLSGRDIFGQAVNAITVTDNSGAYRFNNLSPGSYVIKEVQPSQFIDGRDTAGSGMSSATAGHDEFFITLAAGQNGTNNNFGERGLQPGFINRANFFRP